MPEDAAQGISCDHPDGTPKAEVSYVESRFFESFYRSVVTKEISDRTTIGDDFSLVEARFHYNATENSIIKALSRRTPPPHGAMVPIAEMITRRRALRLLDLGSGTGHWIDFFRDVFLVSEVTGVEITDFMAGYLRSKYDRDDKVRILQDDICSPEFTVEKIGGAVDYISAIGIMFHIVEDTRWKQLISVLATMLKKDGLLIVGGDFGTETKNVQFHKTDSFSSWREYSISKAPQHEIRVNKRVRSLADWLDAAGQAGLSIVDLVRTDHTNSIVTPENDILVLARR